MATDVDIAKRTGVNYRTLQNWKKPENEKYKLYRFLKEKVREEKEKNDSASASNKTKQK